MNVNEGSIASPHESLRVRTSFPLERFINVESKSSDVHEQIHQKLDERRRKAWGDQVHSEDHVGNYEVTELQQLLGNQRDEHAKKVDSPPCHVHMIQRTMYDNEAQNISLKKK